MERNTEEERKAARTVEAAMFKEEAKHVMAEVSVDNLMHMTSFLRKHRKLLRMLISIPGVREELPKEVVDELQEDLDLVDSLDGAIAQAGVWAMVKSGMLEKFILNGMGAGK